MKEENLLKTKLKYINNNINIYNNYKDIIISYQNYINKITNFFNSIITNNNDLLYARIFNILVNSGLFSINNKLHYQEDIPFEISTNPGISVVIGNSCCRNISSFYEDVFKNIYNYPLSLICYLKNIDNNLLNKKLGNHMINITKYNNNYYGIDLSCEKLYYFINNKKLKDYNNKNYIYYKEYGDIFMMLNKDTKIYNNYIETINNKKNMFNISSRNDIISQEEYNYIINNATDFIINNKDLLYDFMKYTYYNKEEIKELIKVK